MLDPPVEGRLMRGEQGLDVGDRVHVKLLSTDPRAASSISGGMHDDLLRHTVATLAYRAGKALRGAPPEFAEYRGRRAARRPRFWRTWAISSIGRCSSADGKHEWHNSDAAAVGPGSGALLRRAGGLRPARWRRASRSVSRRRSCSRDRLPTPSRTSDRSPCCAAWPGCPMRGENYFRAKIETGRVGAEQAAPVKEF